MRIEVKDRNEPVSDELRDHVRRRFEKVGKQVSELALLEVELLHERNPAIAESEVAEVTLHVKGAIIRARDRARDMRHAINLCSEEVSRQVKRDRDKRRRRRIMRASRAVERSGAQLSSGTSPAI